MGLRGRYDALDDSRFLRPASGACAPPPADQDSAQPDDRARRLEPRAGTLARPPTASSTTSRRTGPSQGSPTAPTASQAPAPKAACKLGHGIDAALYVPTSPSKILMPAAIRAHRCELLANAGRARRAPVDPALRRGVQGQQWRLYGVQMPAHGLLRVQWLDAAFLQHARQGLRDRWVTARYTVDGVTLYGEGHRFRGDYGNGDLGREVDLGLTYRRLERAAGAASPACALRPQVPVLPATIRKTWLTLARPSDGMRAFRRAPRGAGQRAKAMLENPGIAARLADMRRLADREGHEDAARELAETVHGATEAALMKAREWRCPRSAGRVHRDARSGCTSSPSPLRVPRAAPSDCPRSRSSCRSRPR